MSDPNKYINTYVDFALGTVHDYLNQILQLKTQLKIANDLVSEKDQVIFTLQDNQRSVDEATQNAKRWEDEVNAVKGKITHMDTLSNQCVEMKHAIQQKNTEIDNLNKELERRKDFDTVLTDLEEAKKKIERLTKKEEKRSSTTAPAKKDINKETTPLSVPSPVAKSIVVDKKVIEENDDF